MKMGRSWIVLLFPTTKPEETVKNVIEYFKDKGVEAIGLGCFGPIDPDKKSKTYGYITTTPKPGWANYNIVVCLYKKLSSDTDWF